MAQPSTNNTTKEKKNSMDIEVIIDKIDKLPITDEDKASLLNQIKQNMMNPSQGEDESLNRIQAKFTSPSLTSQPLLPSIQQIEQAYMPNQLPQQLQMPQYGMSQYGMPSPQMMQMPMPQYGMQPQANVMTTAHFEILKNKLDAVQLELVDLLRHVKDYTQRYMNATRQQDMEKIDAYVNGLFEVDKKMKDAEEKAKEMDEMTQDEEEPSTRESLIGKATSGIKNFIGSIGDNVAGVASLVTNTANIANGYLSKPVLGNTSNASPKITTGNNKNIVSVNDYIESNMNELEGANTLSGSNKTNQPTQPNNPTTTITANANNMNNVKSTEPTAVAIRQQEEPTEDDITKAINKLNATMNEDINNTVKEGDNKLNNNNSNSNTNNNTNSNNNSNTNNNTKSTTDSAQASATPASATPAPATATVQSGGASASRLTKKITLLRLKLTKNKLEKELKKTHINTKPKPKGYNKGKKTYTKKR